MKKPIAFVISNLSGGGAQRVVSTLSHGLSEHFKIYLALHDGKEISYTYRGEIVDLKTPVGGSKLVKLINFIKRILRLRRFKRKISPVAVISFMENANFINLLSGRNGKRIISVRNYTSRQLKSFYGAIFRPLIKGLYNRSDFIVAPSNGIKTDLVKAFGLQEDIIEVIYNPVDLEMIEEKAKQELGKEDKHLFSGPVLVTAGGLIRQKGHRNLVRAFRVIKESIPEMRLVIIGEGQLRAELEELILKLGLGDDVTLAGYRKNPFQYISSSDIFILSSYFEGFPNVLVEAMACGVPVVAADCLTGPREILAPGTDYLFQTEEVEFAKYGILTPVCDEVKDWAVQELTEQEEFLAKAVIKLNQDKVTYSNYREKGLERVNDFSLDKITKQWVELIER